MLDLFTLVDTFLNRGVSAQYIRFSFNAAHAVSAAFLATKDAGLSLELT